MRKFLAMIFVAALLGPSLSACAGVNLPPKAGPEEVELINPNMGQVPDEGYKTIGPIRVEVPLGTSFQDQLMALRTRAAELGADAVIFERTGSSTEGQISGGVDREELIYVYGLAIYWPAPEPEGGSAGGS